MQELIIKRIKTTCRHDNFLHSFIEKFALFVNLVFKATKQFKHMQYTLLIKNGCLSLNSVMLMLKHTFLMYHSIISLNITVYMTKTA